MDQQLKQRLVGVTVIFSLAVIFLPMLLDGAGNRPKHLQISIPTPPQIASYDIVAEKVTELKQQVEKLPRHGAVIVDDISDPPITGKISRSAGPMKKNQPAASTTVIKPTATEKSSTPPAKPERPVKAKKEPVKKHTGGASWVIQAGSFSDKNKAYKLRNKLRKSGLSAVFIEKFKHDGGLSYRVRMGPFIHKDKALVTGRKIRAKYNIKGLVMRYEK